MKRLTLLLLLLLGNCRSLLGDKRHFQPYPITEHYFVRPQQLVDSHRPITHPSWRQHVDGWVYAGEVEHHFEIFWRSSQPGSVPKPLTSGTNNNSEPQLSPDGRWIAWSSQQEDAKGDIWTMAIDGSNKRKWTDRRTEDHAPCWLPDGQGLLYTAVLPDGRPTLRQVLFQPFEDTLVVDHGFDATVVGDWLAFVRVNEQGLAKIYLRKLQGGPEIALGLDDVAEGFPQWVALKPDHWRLIYIRFMTDFAALEGADPSEPTSLWAIDLNEQVLLSLLEISPNPQLSSAMTSGPSPSLEPGQNTQAEPILEPSVTKILLTSAHVYPVPLTFGQRHLLFVSATPTHVLYGTRAQDRYTLEVLPIDGMLQPGLTAHQLLQASLEAQDPLLRQLAVFHVIHHLEPHIREQARYRLAGLLAEQGYISQAIAAYQQLAQQAQEASMGIQAHMAVLRWQWQPDWQQSLQGKTIPQAQLATMQQQLQPFLPHLDEEPSVQWAQCQLTWLQGDWPQALDCWQTVAEKSGGEWGAWAFLAQAQVAGHLEQVEPLEQIVAAMMKAHGRERFLLEQAVTTLMQAIESMAQPVRQTYLIRLHQRYQDKPLLASRALWQLAQGHGAQANRLAWQLMLQQVWQHYPSERAIGLQALVTLGQWAWQQQDMVLAQEILQALQDHFPDASRQQQQARQQVAMLALQQAKQADKQGRWLQAMTYYNTFLQQDGSVVSAHRRYIQLAHQLGLWSQAHAYYQSKLQGEPSLAERYGYGLLLLYQSEPDVEQSQALMQTILARDMRFAAAHLTLGWIALYQEWHQRQPGGLERAIDRFTTTMDLLDGEQEPELWAAAHLNRGLALLHLGKHDGALLDFAARATMTTPFAGIPEEIAFWQHLALAALYRDQLAVAIDAATLALERCQSGGSCSRSISLSALLGGAHLLAARPQSALQLYQKAWQQLAEHPSSKYGPSQQFPLLRGMAMALLQLGQADKAFAYVGQALQLLEQGARGALPQVGWLTTEIAANPLDISAAIYGFETLHEQALLYGLQARCAQQHNQGEQHLWALQRYVAELGRLRQQERQSHRLDEEWYYGQLALLRAMQGQAAYGEGWALLQATLAMAPKAHLAHVQRLVLQGGLALWLSWPEGRSQVDLSPLLARSQWLLQQEQPVHPASIQIHRWLVQAQRWLKSQQVVEHDPHRLNPSKEDGLTQDGQMAATGSQGIPSTPSPPPPLEQGANESGALQILQTALTDLEATLEQYDVLEIAPLLQADGKVPKAWLVLLQACLQHLGHWPATAAGAQALWAPLPGQDLEQAVNGWLASPHLVSHQGSEDVLVAMMIPPLMELKRFELVWQVLERWRKGQWRHERGNNQGGQHPVDAQLAAQVFALGWHWLEPHGPMPWEQLQGLLQTEQGMLWQRFDVPQLGTYIVQHSGQGLVITPWSPQEHGLPAGWLAGVQDKADGPLQGMEDVAVLYVDGGGHVSQDAWLTWLKTWQHTWPQIPVIECLGAAALVVADQLHPLRFQGMWTMTQGAQSGGPSFDPSTPTQASLAPPSGTLAPSQSLAFVDQILALSPSYALVVLHGTDFQQAAWQAPSPLAHGLMWVLVLEQELSPRQRRQVLLQALYRGIGQVLLVPSEQDLASLQASLLNFIPAGTWLQTSQQEGLPGQVQLLGCYGAKGERYVEQVRKTLLGAASSGHHILRQVDQAPSASKTLLRRQARLELLRAVTLLEVLSPPTTLAWIQEHPTPALQRVIDKIGSYALTMQRILADNAFHQQQIEHYVAHTQTLLGLLEQGDQIEQALQLRLQLATNLFKIDNVPLAIEQAQACSQTLEVSVARKYSQPVSQCWRLLASAYQAEYAYAQAEQALMGMAEHVASENELGQAELAWMRGQLAEQQGRAEQIEQHYVGAIALYEQHLIKHPEEGIWHRQQEVVLALTRLYRHQSRYEEALVLLTTSARNPLGSQGSAFELLQMQQWLEWSRIAWYKGQYQEAQDYQQQAYRQAVALEQPALQLEAMSLAGLIAFSLGDLDEAAELFQDTLAGVEGLPHQRQRHLEAATQWSNLGMVHRQAGDLQQAVFCYEQAMQLDQAERHLAGQAYDLRNLGMVRLDQGQEAMAEQLFQQAQAAAEQVGDRYNLLQIVLAQGKLASKQKQERVALQLHERAWQLALEQRALLGGMEAALRLAHHAWRAGDLLGAQLRIEQAMMLAMATEQAATGAPLNAGLREQVFTLALRFSAEQQQVEQLATYLAWQQQRRLWDSLVHVQQHSSKEQRAALAQYQTARRQWLQAMWAKWRGELSAAELLYAEHQLLQVGQRARTLWGPLGSWLIWEPHGHPSCGQLQQWLQDREGVLLIQPADKDVLVMLITAQDVRFHWLEGAWQASAPHLQTLMQGLANLAPVASLLQQLTSHLLEPVLEPLLALQHVYWMPLGALFQLPLPALPMPDGGVLLERMTLSHVPHLPWLAHHLQQRAEQLRTSMQHTASGGLGALANKNGLVKALAYGGSALPFARLEGRAVASRMQDVVIDPNRLQVLQHLQASPNEGALAIAGHTSLTGPGPLDVAIRLGEGPEQQLLLIDLFQASLPALITFGACQTERIRPGEQQWIGFAAASLASGAQTVVGTLAPISDLAAALVFKHFYRQWPAKPPAQALQQALLQVRKHHPHPAFWGTLALLGRPD